MRRLEIISDDEKIKMGFFDHRFQNVFDKSFFSMIDKMFQQEIFNAQLKETYWLKFYFYYCLSPICPEWAASYWIPSGYKLPESSG